MVRTASCARNWARAVCILTQSKRETHGHQARSAHRSGASPRQRSPVSSLQLERTSMTDISSVEPPLIPAADRISTIPTPPDFPDLSMSDAVDAELTRLEGSPGKEDPALNPGKLQKDLHDNKVEKDFLDKEADKGEKDKGDRTRDRKTQTIRVPTTSTKFRRMRRTSRTSMPTIRPITARSHQTRSRKTTRSLKTRSRQTRSPQPTRRKMRRRSDNGATP
jgi:hypothetical protein